MSKDTESVLKNFKRSPGWDSFSGECYQIFKEELTPVFIKLFQKIQGTFPNTFCDTTLPSYFKARQEHCKKIKIRDQHPIWIYMQRFSRYWQTKSSSILKGLYTIIKWNLSQIIHEWFNRRKLKCKNHTNRMKEKLTHHLNWYRKRTWQNWILFMIKNKQTITQETRNRATFLKLIKAFMRSPQSSYSRMKDWKTFFLKI